MEQDNWIIETNEDCIRASAPNADELLEIGKNSNLDNDFPIPEDLLSLSKSELEWLTIKTQIDLIRDKRNKLLLESDWTEMTNILSTDQKQKWILYRQKLRDITKGITTVDQALEIDCPIPPS
jgi:hypothetical protein